MGEEEPIRINPAPDTDSAKGIVSFVMEKVQRWRDYQRTNYLFKWEEYDRIVRGIFHENDRTRKSERSKLITPASQQALESYIAEIEEASGLGTKYFDLKNDEMDDKDLSEQRDQLQEDLYLNGVEEAISDCIYNAGCYGTGIGEIVIDHADVKIPASQKAGQYVLGGVYESKQFCVKLHSVNPKNFFIDPNCTSVHDALGCAIEEFVGTHLVRRAQTEGIYRDVAVGTDGPDIELEADRNLTYIQTDKTKLIRYYGLVPRKYIEYLDTENDTDEGSLLLYDPESDDPASEAYDDLVEACVVIANDGVLLKAEANPYMMGDRPIIVYQCDKLPGRFWGRGIVEKGYNMQKAVDAQLRSHIDNLALSTAPMMAMDSTRMPRGFKYEIYPGRSIPTIGNPNESLMPFKFGEITDHNMAAAQYLERMLNQATGTLDVTGKASGELTKGADGSFVPLAGLIKKNKRSLLIFQRNFLIPLIQKTMWRYMQYDPERYPVKDYKFVPLSSLGIVAREYEQKQYMGMLSTLGPDSPIVPLLLEGVIENSSLTKREEIVAALAEMRKPTPEKQKQAELQMREAEAQVSKIESEAAENMAQVNKINKETELMPLKVQGEIVSALTKNSEEPDEFQMRLDLTDRFLEERKLDIQEKDIESNERIADKQMSNALEVEAKKQSKAKE